MEWIVEYRVNKFLGGFEGEFRYKELYTGKTIISSNDDQEMTEEKAVTVIRNIIKNKTSGIEIMSIKKNSNKNSK